MLLNAISTVAVMIFTVIFIAVVSVICCDYYYAVVIDILIAVNIRICTCYMYIYIYTNILEYICICVYNTHVVRTRSMRG